MHSGTQTEPRMVVWFEGEIALIGDEVPEQIDQASVHQAVQNEIGHTGIAVVRIESFRLDSTDA